MTTKEQERKALAQIKKIVEGLGEGSYIGMAFEGCFEDAEENIENDFGCSMKQRVDKANETAAYYKRAAETFSAEADKARAENEALKKKVLTTAEAGAIKAILNRVQFEAAHLANESAQRIVEAADDPTSEQFCQAVKDNRTGKKREEECQSLIKRLLETMSA